MMAKFQVSSFKFPISMDCCMYISLFAESLHNISYQSLFKSIQIPLEQKK